MPSQLEWILDYRRWLMDRCALQVETDAVVGPDPLFDMVCHAVERLGNLQQFKADLRGAHGWRRLGPRAELTVDPQSGTRCAIRDNRAPGNLLACDRPARLLADAGEAVDRGCGVRPLPDGDTPD